MSDWKTVTGDVAGRLRRNGLAGGALALLVLAIAPPTAGAEGFAGPLAWWLLLAFCLLPLAVSVHLLFDAALFRLAASHDDEATGLAAIDDVLARMGLRSPSPVPPPLTGRLAGCRRLVRLQRLSLAIGVALYLVLFLDMAAGGDM
ncbi:hypothetical protein MUO32_02385 [Shinella sp. CPCC 101442]|uniref:hypothetical protein n=1 Tax=Shinella sp. CPCC 101442 TaxID=2932265 RepID=UPI002153940F|nr:hypothetical protein [Shinella sp. CPCC 101442]MCR6497870.1 hypothetical protein [Shinella sp. CPCC 101442]